MVLSRCVSHDAFDVGLGVFERNFVAILPSRPQNRMATGWLAFRAAFVNESKRLQAIECHEEFGHVRCADEAIQFAAFVPNTDTQFLSPDATFRASLQIE